MSPESGRRKPQATASLMDMQPAPQHSHLQHKGDAPTFSFPQLPASQFLGGWKPLKQVRTSLGPKYKEEIKGRCAQTAPSAGQPMPTSRLLVCKEPEGRESKFPPVQLQVPLSLRPENSPAWTATARHTTHSSSALAGHRAL